MVAIKKDEDLAEAVSELYRLSDSMMGHLNVVLETGEAILERSSGSRVPAGVVERIIEANLLVRGLLDSMTGNVNKLRDSGLPEYGDGADESVEPSTEVFYAYRRVFDAVFDLRADFNTNPARKLLSTYYRVVDVLTSAGVSSSSDMDTVLDSLSAVRDEAGKIVPLLDRVLERHGTVSGKVFGFVMDEVFSGWR